MMDIRTNHGGAKHTNAITKQAKSRGWIIPKVSGSLVRVAPGTWKVSAMKTIAGEPVNTKLVSLGAEGWRWRDEI